MISSPVGIAPSTAWDELDSSARGANPCEPGGARLHKRQSGVGAVGLAGEIGRMARPLRIDVEDDWYHVMNRGIERRAIFTDDEDRLRFGDLLAQFEEPFGARFTAAV